MSALPARAATAGSLALALALALPAAAFADEEDRGRAEQGSSQSEERGRSETAPHGQADDRRDDDKGDDQGDDQGEGGTKGSGDKASKGKGNDGKGSKGSKGSSDEGRAAGGDPRGNNGTIKIDGEAFDDGRGNEPHVGCVFELDFYGFDAGDTASITFTGHAPTGGGLLHSESGTLISNDAAGGGQDRDATLRFSVDDELSELKAIAPHPQQGWHVKVAVDVDGAPGGAKQKVFWLDCPQPAAESPATTPTTGTTVQGAGGGTTTTAPTTTTPTTTTPTTTTTTALPVGGVLPATVVSGTTVAAAERQEALTLGSGTVTLAAGAAEAAAQGDVSAQGAASPSALPFTGSAVLLYLLGLGLSAVGVGAIAHRMGRQQADLA